MVSKKEASLGARWRSKQSAGATAGGNGKGAAPAPAAAVAAEPAGSVPPNVAEAREWIRAWRARNLEKGLVGDKTKAR